MSAHISDVRLERHRRLRVAIVSDTHGKLDPRVAAAVARHDCVIHAGDIGCAAVLNELSTRLDVRVAVRGNNDSPTKWPAADRNILARLADTARLRLPGGEVMVIHGHQAGPPAARHEFLRRAFTGSRLVIYGHSHLRVIDREARPWIANPGAAGRTRAYGGPGLLSLTATSKMWRLRSIVFDPTWSGPTHNPGDRAYPDRGMRQSK